MLEVESSVPRMKMALPLLLLLLLRTRLFRRASGFATVAATVEWFIGGRGAEGGMSLRCAGPAWE